LDADLFLEDPQNRKKVRGAWVPIRTQHSMQALTGDPCEYAQLFETNGCIYEIPQDGFADYFFAAEISINRFRQQSLTESDVTLSSGVSGFSKILGYAHPCLHSSILVRIGLPLFVYRPRSLSIVDREGLAFLFAASEQDDDAVTIFTEINAVAWPKIYLVFVNAGPDSFTFEKFPCSSRYNPIVTFAAAVGLSRRNQCANGDWPDASRYSEI
jgi:hypothetical protein